MPKLRQTWSRKRQSLWMFNVQRR